MALEHQVVRRERVLPVDRDTAWAALRHAGALATWLADEVERRTGFEARVTTLGHVQRGGTPTAFDRVLATRFGVAAVAAVHDGAFATMVALQGGAIVRIPIATAVAEAKTVDLGLYRDVAGVFLG